MDDMFARGLELMMVGMGVVFSFLLLLVWLVGLMSRAVARLAPDAAPPVAGNAPPATPESRSATVDGRTLTVIREAVRRHRER